MLSRDPALRARAGLLRLQRRALLAGDPYAEALAAGLDAAGASVIEGWRRGGTAAGIELRTLEAELVKVSPRHPLYADALRLRAAWRLASEESTHAAEALDLLDVLIALEGSAQDLVSRARAAGLAGYPRIALVDLSDVVSALEQDGSPRRRGVISRTARAALRALRELPEDFAHRAAREELQRKFRALLPAAPQRMRRHRQPQ